MGNYGVFSVSSLIKKYCTNKLGHRSSLSPQRTQRTQRNANLRGKNGVSGVFSVSSASSVVKKILLIVSVTYQKHCDALLINKEIRENGQRGILTI
jgi:hypothetical protein